MAKKHAIIPIFIPHRGCPNDCVFCNQRAITARSEDVTPEDARRIIDEWLGTLEGRGLEEIEVSFFGGSFTGIPIEEQTAFLKVAKEYKDAGRVDKIHLSTRPDYIDKTILDNLQTYGADVIELGVQSFSETVLFASRRGHNRQAVIEACELIKSYGCFTLGIQLMIGLPGDSYESCMYSVNETIKIGPAIARLYPTVIISDTHLAEMYKDGSYVPPTQEEIIRRTKDMYRTLTEAGINVIRVGLKSTSLINDGDGSYVLGNTYHPAIKQLVTGELLKEDIERSLAEQYGSADSFPAEIDILINRETMSDAVGHKNCNRRYFDEKYPGCRFRFIEDRKLQDGEFKIE